MNKGGIMGPMTLWIAVGCYHRPKPALVMRFRSDGLWHAWAIPMSPVINAVDWHGGTQRNTSERACFTALGADTWRNYSLDNFMEKENLDRIFQSKKLEHKQNHEKTGTRLECFAMWWLTPQPLISTRRPWPRFCVKNKTHRGQIRVKNPTKRACWYLNTSLLRGTIDFAMESVSCHSCLKMTTLRQQCETTLANGRNIQNDPISTQSIFCAWKKTISISKQTTKHWMSRTAFWFWCGFKMKILVGRTTNQKPKNSQKPFFALPPRATGNCSRLSERRRRQMQQRISLRVKRTKQSKLFLLSSRAQQVIAVGNERLKKGCRINWTDRQKKEPNTQKQEKISPPTKQDSKGMLQDARFTVLTAADN